MSIGDIDSTLPVGQMHLVERSSDLFHQHGGIATAVQFDSLEEMSLDKFLTEVAPTMKDRKDTFTVIKDTTHDQLVRILGDNVAIYHVTGMQDVFYDAFVERLVSGEKITITPNLRYPLIQWKVDEDGSRDITVEIPPQLFEMEVNGISKRFPIYHPLMWMRVRLTPANVPTMTRMAALREHVDDLDNAQLGHMPFPNVHDSGDICWGHTAYQTPKGVKLTESVAIELTYRRFFNSQFNYDLLSSRDMSEIERIYDKMPKIKEFQDMLTSRRGDSGSSYRHMIRLARVFSELDGVRQFKPYNSMSATDFLARSSRR